jgi:uncharacterized protein
MRDTRATIISRSGHDITVLSDGWLTWLGGPLGTIVRVPTVYLRLAPGLVFRQLCQLDALNAAARRSIYYVTVLVTMACNFRCSYCFQTLAVAEDGTVTRLPADVMSYKEMDDTCRFADEMRRRQGKTGTHLLIFGGEALMWPERCYYLLEHMPHLVSAAIVTNGYLLTPEVALRLGQLGVSDIQVTFDGDRDHHDRARVTANGRGTYDEILDNLAAIDCLEVLPNRTLRVNVTRDNINSLEELLDDLAARVTSNRYTISFAIVGDLGFGWKGEALLHSHSVTQRLLELYRQADRLGFLIEPPSDQGCGYCKETFGEGGAVVDPKGRLSSCWENAGLAGSVVGDVRSGYMPAETHGDRWVSCSAGSPSSASDASYDPVAFRLGMFELCVRQMQRRRS